MPDTAHGNISQSARRTNDNLVIGTMPEETSDQRGSLTGKLIVAGVILIVLALGFNALLSYGSLEKLYIESIASSYRIVGRDLQRKLEQSLRFGKNIRKFIGMNQLLEETKSRLLSRINPYETPVPSGSGRGGDAPERPAREAVNVSVALPDGSILYSADETLVGTSIPLKLLFDHGNINRDRTPHHAVGFVKYQDTYLITLPVMDRDQGWAATIVLTFQERQVRGLLEGLLGRTLKTIGAILLTSVAILWLLLHLLTAWKPGGMLAKRWIHLGIFLILCGAQVVFSVLSIRDFQGYNLLITRAKAETLATLLKEDIEYLLAKGIQVNKLVKVDTLMAEIIAASPELEDLTIFDRDGTALYKASKEGVVNLRASSEAAAAPLPGPFPVTEGSPYNLRIDLSRDGDIQGFISATISVDTMRARQNAMILDSATVLIISVLFLVEILMVVLPLVVGFGPAEPRHPILPYRTMRPAAFLFLFGIDTSISFLPLHMGNLYHPSIGLSRDFLMGLPISVQMLFTGVGVFLAGAWCDRRGWHEPFLAGLLLSGLGFAYAWASPDALQFIFALGTVGFGYGLSLMGSQGFVIAHTDEKTKAHGLAYLYAGIFAGSICGSAVGGMLAERLGYPPIFLLGSVILLGCVPYTLFTMNKAMVKPPSMHHKAVNRTREAAKILPFLLNRQILALILFSSMPAAIALVGFVNYYSPVYLKSLGTSQSDIGRIFMIYGLCLIYVGPLITKCLDVSRNQKRYVMASGIIGGLAFLSFLFLSGYAATALTVFLLGLSASFGACRNAYALNLRVSQELGQGKAMGVFLSAARLGQVVGPMTFSWLVATAGTTEGLPYFGLAYILITLFLLMPA